MRSRINLAWQVCIALLLGILVGLVLHGSDDQAWWNTVVFQPAGDIFIRLIGMIVVPIVISTMILGIASLGDAKSLGRIGFKTVLYFEVITTVAIFVGIGFGNFFTPGAGIDIASLTTTDISRYQTTQHVVEQQHGLGQVIVNLIPINVFAAMSAGSLLPIIFFSVIFGLALASLPADTKQPLINTLKAVAESMLKVTTMIMRYAPIGVFALVMVTVSRFGFASLVPLAKLVATLYVAVAFFALIVLGAVARLFNLSLLKIIKTIREELLLTYSTASSESVIARIIAKTERMGAPRSISSFVIPTGYSFNLDGSTLYQSLAVLFIAQLYGIDLTFTHQLMIVITLMLTSKGIAAVPGASIVVLLATLTSVGIPVEGVAFIIGVDRIMDMARSALNLLGNALATLVIAKWEGKLAPDSPVLISAPAKASELEKNRSQVHDPRLD
ncbi:cation:dicarboxylate symporter family transporter [Pseudomonas amygdali]|uniref:cation:dicarboxylate symporter family transporter n=1 Tax=Pseudomonas amygdali TaxID=47877 RepID=UPI00076CAE25|nr:cation:dicarboxylase symporter family transporter [Pseudomonas amygdali]KWS82158.1 glutamate:protein symporter [Pseudomonas amygdali pv. dendropanacis]